MRVAIIGAGPAGLSAARGLDADVFEEHDSVGLPRHCTSLVSSEGAESSGISPSLVVSKYNLVTLMNLRGDYIVFRLRKPVYMIDRPGLEDKLAEGIAVKLRSRVTGVEGHYIFVNNERRGPYDVIVIAEGAARRFSERYGKVVRLPGLQIDARIAGRPLEEMNVIYDRRISQSYFAWVVHIDGELYRIGLADRSQIPQKLQKLLKIFRAEPVSKPFGGGVLAGPPAPRLVVGPHALVGDAAGLTKPLSGGGIVLALKSGVALRDSINKGDLGLYESALRPTLLRLKVAHLAYKFMYERGFVHKSLALFSKSEFLAYDYDDHVKTLLLALMTTHKAPIALAEGLRYYLRSEKI